VGPTWQASLLVQSVALLLFLVFTATAVAQQPGVELQLETKTLEPGEAVNAQLVCTNTGLPGLPQVSVPEGLELRLTSSRPSSSSFTQIINGRRSQRTTYTYAMRLTALTPGTYTLGPIIVEADGTTYRTRPMRIVVRESEAASTPKGDRFLFAEIEVEPRSLYVTETLTATLAIGIRKVELKGRIFEMNLLDRVLNQRASQLSVFPGGDVRRTERWLLDTDGVRHRYEVFYVTKHIRAEEVGTMRVGPVFLKANYPTRIRSGFFGGFEVGQARKETARCPAVIVEVKGPPEEGRPNDYTGAIGRFAMNVTARPLRVEQGQPVTLAVAITGSPLEGVAGPDLTRQPELASRFDYTRDELVGDVESGAKVFRRAVFPKQAGEQTIPAISWSFFDTRRERYITLTSEPIAITVDPPSATPATLILPSGADSEPKMISLTVLTGGISPNYIDADAVLAHQSFKLTAPWVASLVISPLAWLVVTLTARHRARLKGDLSYARRRRARRNARARISRALKDGKHARQWDELAQSITGYLSDRFGLGRGTLTPEEVKSLLESRGIEDGTVSRIVGFLQTCDAARYAPGAFGALSIPQAAKMISGWIDRIERGKH
jgi:hypothetical protein